MTKKKAYQKVLSLIMALFLGMLLCPNTAKAATVSNPAEIKQGFKKTVTYSKKDKKDGHYFRVINWDKVEDGKINKVSVKKNALGKVKIGSSGFNFYPKKTGSTKVTVSAVMDGRKVKYTGTITVKKFSQPFKKLLINGKECRKKVASGVTSIDITKRKGDGIGTVQYKLNPGWRVTKMYDEDFVKIKTKTKFKMSYGNTTVCLRHKSGTEVRVSFYTYN